MAAPARVLAVDLGASSGRVMLGEVTDSSVALRELHRFDNRPVSVAGTLHWDVLSLWAGILDGLREARRLTDVRSVGVDSWAIDYALLDADGQLLGNPVHYRDGRTDGVAAAVFEQITAVRLFQTTGVQPLPFNTVFQLVAERRGALLDAAAGALLIPDLIGYWLSGERGGAELTNASTTGLLDTRTHDWTDELSAELKLPHRLFGGVRQPGTPVGELTKAVRDSTGLGASSVVTVGSHDTASAVVAVPAKGASPFAYISCGTWSLVGVELDEPVTSEQALADGFSNELGVDDTVRFLRNVMGLWLLQESVRAWTAEGSQCRVEDLVARASRLPSGRWEIDPDRPEFLPPGDMPERIRRECARTDQPVPRDPAEVTRCIIDSLAAAYERSLRSASQLTGVAVEVVHIVGGGARNRLLCQLTADRCQLPVVAGPVEATAYGNVLVQARAAGVLTGGLPDLRARLADLDTTTYQPR